MTAVTVLLQQHPFFELTNNALDDNLRTLSLMVLHAGEAEGPSEHEQASRHHLHHAWTAN